MKKIRIFKRNKEKISPSGSFIEVVERIAKNGGGTAHIYRKDPEDATKRFVADKDIKDLKDAEIMSLLRNLYGGGDFIIQLDEVNEQGVPKFVKEFRFNVEGGAKESRYEGYKRQREDKEMATTITKDVLSFAKDMFPQKDDSAITALVQSNATMMQTMMMQFMESQKNQMEMFMRMFEHNKQSNNPIMETLEGIMSLNQVKEALTPTVNQDSTLEWAKIFMQSPLTAGLAGKMLGVEMPKQQALPMAEIPKPGQPDLEVNSGLLPEVKEKSTPSQILDATPLNNKDHANFEQVMIDPLIELINTDAEPAEIAQAIQQIINWTLTSARSGKEPHPIMNDFVMTMIAITQGNFDIAKLEDAYNSFARNIEMPAELVEPVKKELANLYLPLLAQAQRKGVAENADIQ